MPRLGCIVVLQPADWSPSEGPTVSYPAAAIAVAPGCSSCSLDDLTVIIQAAIPGGWAFTLRDAQLHFAKAAGTDFQAKLAITACAAACLP